MTLELEKQIDFKLSYSKHFVFSLPFQYKNGKMNYPIPNFLEIKIVHVQKRFLQFLFKPILNFLQLVLTNEIPLVLTGKIILCSDQCKSPKPLQVSIQMSIAEYQGQFSGLGLKKSFGIPINVETPEWKFCLPFLNICPKSLEYENNLQKVATSAKNCSDNPCQNNGY